MTEISKKPVAFREKFYLTIAATKLDLRFDRYKWKAIGQSTSLLVFSYFPFTREYLRNCNFKTQENRLTISPLIPRFTRLLSPLPSRYVLTLDDSFRRFVLFARSRLLINTGTRKETKTKGSKG